jgi:light-regulated signal transduction histidine kinase (bacteriophytochrome)
VSSLDGQGEVDELIRLLAHNLKEPLVNIEGYARLLRNEFGGKVGDEGKGFLETLLRLSGHTKGLLNDLLEYSRLSESPPELEEIPVGELVDAVLKEFEFLIQDKGAVLEIQPGMPAVRFDRKELAIVFRNLISNALKFSGEFPPRVHVGFESGERETVFHVLDNGIGIPQENLEKVLGLFQRLHPDDLYPGTGIGLAMTRRIVERRGGRLWLESEEGKGTKALFTIPD